MKRTAAKKEITPAPEVMESLWRVVDAARIAIQRPDSMSPDDALEFLADQEKMLRRAIGFFHGGEDTLREGITKHPFILDLERAELERVARIMKDSV